MIKHSTYSLLIALLMIVIPALQLRGAEEQMRVAIFDPSTSGPLVDEGTKVAVRELIGSAMVNSGDFTILERSMINKVMEELKFSNTDAVDEGQASELGKLAGANKVVLSVISRVGTRNMLSIKIIDVETASIERQKAKVVKPDMLLDEVEPMVAEMLGKALSGSSKSVAQSKSSAKENSEEEKAAAPVEEMKGNILQCYFVTMSGETQEMQKTVPVVDKEGKAFLKAFIFEFPGKKSDRTIHFIKPTFLVRLAPNDMIERLYLVKLNQNKDKRMFIAPKDKDSGNPLYLTKSLIQCEIIDKGNNVYLVSPKKTLKKGQYALIYNNFSAEPECITFDVD